MRINDRIVPQNTVMSGRTSGLAGHGGRFSIDHSAEPPGETGATAKAPASANVASLLELQIAENSPVERRRRSVRRGTKLLDGLDRLKAAFLIGADQPADWEALQAEFNMPRDPTLPPEVAALLDHIDVRVAVELAKRGL